MQRGNNWSSIRRPWKRCQKFFDNLPNGWGSFWSEIGWSVYWLLVGDFYASHRASNLCIWPDKKLLPAEMCTVLIKRRLLSTWSFCKWPYYFIPPTNPCAFLPLTSLQQIANPSNIYSLSRLLYSKGRKITIIEQYLVCRIPYSDFSDSVCSLDYKLRLY